MTRASAPNRVLFRIFYSSVTLRGAFDFKPRREYLRHVGAGGIVEKTIGQRCLVLGDRLIWVGAHYLLGAACRDAR